MKLRIVALIGVLAVASASLWAAPKRITVVNKTSQRIDYIYISEADNESWEDDVMGAEQTLAAGARINITFDGYSPESCLWDFKAVDSNGEEYFLYDVNLCQVSVINITE